MKKIPNLPRKTALLLCPLLLIPGILLAFESFIPEPFNSTGESADSVLRSVWHPVEVSSSLPSSFRQSKPNHISFSEHMTSAFDTLCYSGRPLRIIQIGDSHVAGKAFPRALCEKLQLALGAAPTDSLGFGIHFDYMARNGATAARMLTPERLQQVALLRPDLLILSFGTNECHSLNYREAEHQAELESVTRLLRQYLPQTALLLTTPPGDYLYQRRYRQRRPNPMSARCAAVIRQWGENHRMAVWDLNSIAGGGVAPRNWSLARLLRNDRVHFTPEGYTLHGHLLAEAILTAYNAYLRQRDSSSSTTGRS